MTGRRWVQTIAPVLAAAVITAGCSATRDGDEGAAGSASGGSASVVDRLAEAGIAVFADPGDPEPIVPPADPVSPVQLLEWQVPALAAEADLHSGFAAEKVDALVGERSGSLTAADVIAGWARYGETPAADWAHEILGDSAEHPDEAVFGNLVLLLFTSDVATAGASPAEPSGGGGGGSPMGSTAQPVTHAPCSALVNWVDRTIAYVFNAIGHVQELKVKTFIGGWFDKLVNAAGKLVAAGANFIIDGAHFVINKTTRVLIAPVMGFIGRVAGVVGTVAQVGSVLRPWSPKLVADPPVNAKAVLPAEGLPGRFTFAIELGGLSEWPPALADCAAQAGKPLPPLKPRGNPVTWKIDGPGLVQAGERDPALREDATATAHYRTTQETMPKKAKQQRGTVHATATVQRDDLTELRKAFVKLLDDAMAQVLPPIIDQIVNAQVKRFVLPFADKTLAKLEHLRDETATVTLPVTYHVPGDDEPGPASPDRTAPPKAKPVLDRCPNDKTLSAATGTRFKLYYEGAGMPVTGEKLPLLKYNCVYMLNGKFPAGVHISFWDPGTTVKRVFSTYAQASAALGATARLGDRISVPGATAAWPVHVGGEVPGYGLFVEVNDRVFSVDIAVSQAPRFEQAVRAAASVVLGTS